MQRFVQHCPGGIPRSIKPHPETDLSLDQIKEEVKGWLILVGPNVCVAIQKPTENTCIVSLYGHNHRWIAFVIYGIWVCTIND